MSQDTIQHVIFHISKPFIQVIEFWFKKYHKLSINRSVYYSLKVADNGLTLKGKKVSLT